MSTSIRFAFVTVLLCASVVMATAVTVPQILTIGPEEFAGSNGRLSDIATDMSDQPHIVSDGGSYAYMYDRVGGTWRSVTQNVAPYNQFYNPSLEIDRNNRSYCSGILVAGLGFIVRDNVNTTTPGEHGYVEYLIEPAWDSGNLSIDPGKPGYCVGISARGHWSEFMYDTAAPGALRQVDAGQLNIISGGEKNFIKISTAGNVAHPNGGNHAIWHAVTDTGYQNSFRNEKGMNYVEWASWGRYGEIHDDGAYPTCVGDNVDPYTAYMVHGWGDTGVKINIWQGNPDGSGQMIVPSTDLIEISQGGSGGRRFGVQLAAAKNGGAFIIWSRGGQVIVRYIARDGTLGPETPVGSGSLANICTDSKGNLHVVYNNNGIRYRKLSVSGNAAEATSKACDFDGDGTDDVATFDSATATWSYRSSINKGDVRIQFGMQGDIPVPGNYIGNETAELAVFRPSDATWYIRGNPVGIQFGSAELSDVPVPADYNGDGVDELAVFRPSTSEWIVRGSPAATAFGMEGDQPIPGDYNGDNIDEIAVFRPSTATWLIRGVGNTVFGSLDFTDIPVPADYDGDGKVDIAIFRQESGTWHVLGSKGPGIDKQFGDPSNTLVPGDYDGDGKADFSLFNPSSAEWSILKSSSGYSQMLMGAPVVFGASDDLDASADWDGDGVMDIAVFRPSNAAWYRWGSAVGPMGTFVFGQANHDIPIPEDWDGDGRADFAVFRPSTAAWYRWGSRFGDMPTMVFGQANGDIPVPADYDGDGKADFAVFRPSTAAWYRWGSLVGDMPTVVFGQANHDVPAPGDYDNDGKADIAVFRPSTGTWYWLAGTQGPAGSRMFGSGSSTPVPGDYDNDGQLDISSFESGRWWIFQSEVSSVMEGSAPFVFGSPSDMPIGARSGSM